MTASEVLSPERQRRSGRLLAMDGGEVWQLIGWLEGSVDRVPGLAAQLDDALEVIERKRSHRVECRTNCIGYEWGDVASGGRPPCKCTCHAAPTDVRSTT